MTPLRSICLVGLVLLLLCGCGGDREPMNLVLVTLDTTRADRIGCYGAEQARTPTLDGLAASGLLFEQALAPYPLTLPSHASMLTGRYPFEHGSRNNGMPPREDVPTITERLREEGYRTAAVLSAMVLGPEAGLARGFEIYDTEFTPPGSVERRGDATTDAAMRALDQFGDDRFFLWVHYFDPHHPYDPPAEFAQEDPYDGEIAFMDAQIGRLLAHLGPRRANTAILVVADHGEAFGEHGELEHGLLVYEPTVHVPLILSMPGEAAQRVTQAVSAIDVAPTLLALAGLGVSSMDRARDLRQVAQGRVPERALVAESILPFYNHGAEPLAAARHGDWKYISAPRPELYDLRADPLELTNLHDAQESRARAMEKMLAEVHPLEWTTGEVPDASERLDEKTRAMLASLGYVGGDPGVITRADPKDVVAALALVREGSRHEARMEFDRAEAAYRQALELLPHDWKATWHLGDLLVRQERLEDARVLYRAAREADPRNLSIALRLGQVLRRMGRARPALEELTAVLRAYPRHRLARTERALTFQQLGRIDEARSELRELVKQEPNAELERILEQLSH